MIRAIRPRAMAQDDASMIAGWNISPNTEYTLLLTPGASACGVLLFNSDMSVLIASGAALVGTEQPCVLVSQSVAVGMLDVDLGWHLLVTTTGTESQRTIRLGPAVDLPDEIHPIYADDDLAVARATAGVDDHAHYPEDISVSCPFGFGAWIGDVARTPVDGSALDGQTESITWAGTPNGASDSVVIRRYVPIAPEAFVEIAPPTVANDAGTATHLGGTSGNVLTNDASGLSVSAVGGLSSNVGIAVAGDNGGKFTISADGSWTFDPDGDFALLEGSETANTSVTYHASDGTAEATATLTVTVSHANTAPVAVDDTGETTADATTSGNVLTNDTDSDLDALTVSQVAGSAANVGVAVAGSLGGLFTIGSDGAWTFNPNSEFSSLSGEQTATTSVSYHVSDGAAEDEGMLTVTVSATIAPDLWTPAQIPLLQMWKDGSALSSFTIPDPIDTIVKAVDKSGSGRHAIEKVSTKKGANCIQSIGEFTPMAVAIDGIADGTVNEYTVFIMAKPTKASAAGSSQSNSGVVFYTSDSNNNIPFNIAGNTSTTSSPVAPTFSITSNYIALAETRNSLAPYLVNMAHSVGQNQMLAMFERNTSRNTRGGVNGTYQAGATGAVASLSWLSAEIMSKYTDSSLYQGSIYEIVLVHNGALGSSIIQSMEGYFAHKWDAIFGNNNLKNALPAGHPYKTTAPSFSPADISTALWIDFSDVSSLTFGQGGHITSWADLSANGRHSTQVTLASCPMRIKDGVALLPGRNYVQDWSFLNGKHYHIAMVCSFLKTMTGENIIGSMTNADLGMLYAYVSANAGFSSHNSAGTDINLSTGVTPALPANTPAMWAWNYEWGPGRRVFRGGIQRGSVVTTKSVSSFNNGRIGLIYSGGGASVKLHEIVAISSISYADISPYIQKIDGYLAHKWDAILGTSALVGDLAASHPYKSAAPTI